MRKESVILSAASRDFLREAESKDLRLACSIIVLCRFRTSSPFTLGGFICRYDLARYSHSIVPGGFEVMSYTTRLMPRTSLIIRLEIVRSTSYGSGAQSAVMPSSLSTARIAQVLA